MPPPAAAPVAAAAGPVADAAVADGKAAALHPFLPRALPLLVSFAAAAASPSPALPQQEKEENSFLPPSLPLLLLPLARGEAAVAPAPLSVLASMPERWRAWKEAVISLPPSLPAAPG